MKAALSFLFFVSMLNVYAQSLDGAYKIVAAQYGNDTLSRASIAKQHIIKIFKNGHWIGAFFGDPQKPFFGTGGGTYTTKDDKYIETLEFYSWDSTAAGKVFNFNYALKNDRYFQDGFINSDKYKNYLIKEEYKKINSEEPLKNNLLEGVWELQSADWLTNEEVGDVDNFREIKIYSYPRFAWAQYNSKTNHFIGAGGGTYSYNGEKLVEHIEYITYDIALSSDVIINVTKNTDHQIELSSNEAGKEKWKRLP